MSHDWRRERFSENSEGWMCPLCGTVTFVWERPDPECEVWLRRRGHDTVASCDEKVAYEVLDS